jgi:predicted MFS family arabinose efflux permease
MRVEDQTAPPSAAAPSDKPALSPGYVNGALGLLLVIYTLNFVDRQIVGILAEDIKRDLNLSDAQLGLMGGLAFALFYTVLGIPIARIAERGNRVQIISASLAVWSAFTALCGTASNFAQLMAYRIGVGVGEAGCTPPAHSLISDYVPPEKRASALALYSLGVPLGTMIGFAVGAWIASEYGWRVAFYAVGLPGVALAIFSVLVLKEPRKLGLVATHAPGTGPSFGDALKELASLPSYWYAVFAATVVSFLGYGHAYFLGSFLGRVHGMELQERGLALALMIGLAGALGTWAGGALADRAAKRDVRAYMTLPAVAFVIGTPFFYAGMFAPTVTLCLLLLAIPTALNSIWYGPVYASVQGMVRPQTRATAVAIMFFVINLVGLGAGPTTIGIVSDMIATSLYTGADFSADCARGGPLATDASCLTAQAEGLRWSLSVVALVGVLAVGFFFMARRTIREDLAKAQA